MASTVPARIKQAAPDIQRLAVRAAQLRNVKPIVSYWCEFYIVQLLLAKNLHIADEECTNYAAQLMDKLEQYKEANAQNDAVIDDVAAKVYIEEFALETFNRADEAQRANKVSKQTPDTFQAAATFFELLNIWGPLDQEVQAKLKFAKFHALRIARAFKAGEDPNATNPVVEPPPQADNALDDGLEAELKNMENDAGVYKPPTVESAPESVEPSRPHSTFQTDPLSQPPMPDRTNESSALPQEPDISPIDPADNVNSRAGSVGGGYFPSIPGAPSNINSAGPLDQPPSVTPTFTSSDPADFYGQPSAPPMPPPEDLTRPTAPTPHQMSAQPPTQPPMHAPSPAVSIPPPPQVAPRPAQPPPPSQSSHSGPPPGGYKVDDDSIMAAQKHAKWAISALNFEDVNTAVKELRIALQNLGAN